MASGSSRTGLKRKRSDSEEKPTTLSTRRQDFAATLASRDDTEIFSDFEICCKDSSWPVHRLVLSLHSGYFNRLFRSDFSESRTGKVTLEGDPAYAVHLMVDYCYKLDYDEKVVIDPPRYERVRGSRAQIHAQMWTMGDKYDVDGLKKLASQKLKHRLSEDSLEKLSDKALWVLAYDLGEATKHIYENTPPHDHSLRAVAVQGFTNHGSCLVRFADKDRFHELLAEFPEFTAEYLAAAAGVTPGEHWN